MLAGVQRVTFPTWASSLAASLVGVAVARPAVAEVMDKELSRSDIVHALLLSWAFAAAAALLHRWLLFPLFALGPTQEVGFAWTEWHDPFVGPAIIQEDGFAYGLVADGCMTIAVAAHLGLWFLSSRFRHRSRGASQDLTFTAALLVAVLFHAALGFSLTWRSLLSLPTVVAVVGVIVAGHRFRRERLVTLPD
jgi:hypothetical protein